MNRTSAATGLSHGHRAEPQHVTRAVHQAMQRAGVSRASAVVLFLTPEYAANPEPALRAAVRESHCLQVIGATGAGILTEQEWVLDSPGAAAMIFTEPLQLRPPTGGDLADNVTVLSFSTPSGLRADWLPPAPGRPRGGPRGGPGGGPGPAGGGGGGGGRVVVEAPGAPAGDGPLSRDVAGDAAETVRGDIEPVGTQSGRRAEA